jgi:hypothetical protein
MVQEGDKERLVLFTKGADTVPCRHVKECSRDERPIVFQALDA